MRNKRALSGNTKRIPLEPSKDTTKLPALRKTNKQQNNVFKKLQKADDVGSEVFENVKKFVSSFTDSQKDNEGMIIVRQEFILMLLIGSFY
jgi:hypothetical protein